MRLGFVTLLGAIPLFLAGCTGGPVQPSPTADQVLAVQYRAKAAHGAMSGSEADAVIKAYREDIAKPAAAPSALTSGGVTDK